jgi:hypothetical protein
MEVNIKELVKLPMLITWVYIQLLDGPKRTSSLAARAGVSERTIRRAVETLQVSGLGIVRERGAAKADKKPDTGADTKLITTLVKDAASTAYINGGADTGADIEADFERELELMELDGLRLRGANETDTD